MEESFESKYIHTNGVRLHVVMAGPEDGPLVVLLHGFPEFWRGWIKQIRPIAEAGFRVMVPDQRGYNLSDKPVGIQSYRMNELGADIVGLIKSNGKGKAIVVGHDWGAMVAWWLGIRYPHSVEKLGILNVSHPGVFRSTLARSPEQVLRSWYAMFFQIPALPEAILRSKDWARAIQVMKTSSRQDENGHSLAFDEEDFEHYRRAWSQKGAMRSMMNWYRANMRMPPDLSGDLRVHVPTLMLWGARDIFLSRKMVEPSIEMCDDGRLIIFDEASHWVQHEEVGAVNGALLDFFKCTSF